MNNIQIIIYLLYQMEDQNGITAEYRKQIYDCICQFLPQWKNFQLSEVQIDRMTGITNQIYRIQHPKHKPLIYRKFGQSQTNVFLDRDAEELVYKHISEQKQGPKIYAMNKTVRLESFITSDVLKTEEMLASVFMEKVAYSLRYFHQMKAPNIDQRSLFNRIFYSNDSKIMQICQDKLNQPIFDDNEKEEIQILKKWICKDEIQFLQQATKPLQKIPFVFSHNDLLANNILIKKKNSRTVFIDYEYSCFNYRIFDIANYFNETEYDYNEKNDPYFKEIQKTEQQEKMKDKFIRCYCLATLQYEDYANIVMKNQDFQLNQQQTKLYKELKNQLELGLMLSNIMWGWWAVIVCKNPHINFNYIKFAMKRYRDYMSVKQSGKYKLS